MEGTSHHLIIAGILNNTKNISSNETRRPTECQDNNIVRYNEKKNMYVLTLKV